MMDSYHQLRDVQVPTRKVAALVGVSRTTVYRKPSHFLGEQSQPPPNKLTTAERAEILAVLDSDRFVDMAPPQIYIKLLDDGIYLGSVSTLYRVLSENRQVKERGRLATHPPHGLSLNWKLRHQIR